MKELKVTVEIVSKNERHARLKVWQNGGLAGELTVETEVAEEMSRRLRGADLKGALFKLTEAGRTIDAVQKRCIEILTDQASDDERRADMNELLDLIAYRGGKRG